MMVLNFHDPRLFRAYFPIVALSPVAKEGVVGATRSFLVEFQLEMSQLVM